MLWKRRELGCRSGTWKPSARRRAASATEFAIVLPLLILLALGCVDFGRFACTYVAVINSARAAADTGASSPMTSSNKSSWTSAVQKAAVSEWSSISGFNSGQLSVTVSSVTINSASAVQVTTSYPFATLVSWPGIPSSVTLSATCTFPVLQR